MPHVSIEPMPLFFEVVPVFDETTPDPIPVPTVPVEGGFTHVLSHVVSDGAGPSAVLDGSDVNNLGLVQFLPPFGDEFLVNVAASKENMKVLLAVFGELGDFDVALHESSALEPHI